MTTKEEINLIVSREYNDYRGRMMTPMMLNHAEMRKELGDEYFLLYLKKEVAENPRPVFELDLSKYTFTHGKEEPTL